MSATRSQTEDIYKKDHKFLISEKENVPAKRDTDVLILAKDSGKQFSGGKSIYLGGESDTYCPLVDKSRFFSHFKSLNF